jgi:hypothetical protein
MKRRMMLAVFVLVLPLLAQEAKKQQDSVPAKEETVSKVFEIKYREPSTFSQLLAQSGAKVTWAQGLKALAVTGQPAVVDAVGEAIKRFDVPVKNAELTAYLLSATQKAGQTDAVPKDLEAVVRQLRSLFTYQGFRVLDTMVARTREGQSLEMNSTGPGDGTAPAATQTTATYRLALRSVSVTPDGKEHLIKLDSLRFSARVPSGNLFSDTGINTDLDVREGQKVVVGKTGVGNSGDALILVVTAKIVE